MSTVKKTVTKTKTRDEPKVAAEVNDATPSKVTFTRRFWHTLLVECPNGYTCNICMESRVHLQEASAPKNDTTPAILACGHIFGKDCIEAWLNNGTSGGRCPICRKAPKYKLCDHRVPLHLAHEANVIHIPEPPCIDTEVVDDECLKCRLDTAGRMMLDNMALDKLAKVEEKGDATATEIAIKNVEKWASAFVPYNMYMKW